MRYLFDLADQYIRECDWKDLALLKLCLCAMGILLGAAAPARWKKPLAFGAVGVFIATYIPLMAKFLAVCFPGVWEDKR